MGFFSKKKDSSNQKIEFIGIHGQVATIKSLLLAAIRGVSMDINFAKTDIKPDQLHSYQNINISDQVPILKQGDFSVSGARGIQTYIDIRGTGASLYPRKARVLGQQNYWIEVGYKILAPAVQAIVDDQGNDDIQTQCDKVLASLDGILEENQFVAGPLTLADPQVAAYIYVLKGAGKDLQAYSNITNWITRLEGEMSGDLKVKYLSLVHSDSEQLVA